MAKTWQSMLAVLAVTSAALFTGAPSALAQDDGGGGPDPTTASTAERVSAEVLPAVMYIQVNVHTWVRDMRTGQSYSVPDRTLTCTGFSVGPSGVIATAGHCVNDQDLLDIFAREWAQQDAAAGYDYQQSYDYSMSNYKLEGQEGNSPPDRTITVYRATSTSNSTGAGMLAQVVDQKGYFQGDAALLKVDATNLPTVEVVPSDAVNTGTAIMSVGYPATRNALVDPSLAPTWKDGAVSSRQNSNGVPFLEITSELGHGMSGGPTVNQQGQVVGINSRGATDDADSSNFVVPSSALIDMMARNGVRSEAGPVDVAYRGGLDDYYSGQYSDATDEFQRVLDLQPDNRMASEYRVKALAAYNQFGDKGSLGLVGWLLVGGGALVVVGALITVLLVRRSRKRRAAQAAPAPVEMSQAQQTYAGSSGHRDHGSHPAPGRGVDADTGVRCADDRPALPRGRVPDADVRPGGGPGDRLRHHHVLPGLGPGGDGHPDPDGQWWSRRRGDERARHGVGLGGLLPELRHTALARSPLLRELRTLRLTRRRTVREPSVVADHGRLSCARRARRSVGATG